MQGIDIIKRENNSTEMNKQENNHLMEEQFTLNEIQ